MRIKLTFAFICFFLAAKAQEKDFFVLFKDKNNSTFSVIKPQAFLSQRAIQRRKTQGISISTHDLPPSPSYVSSVKKIANVRYVSKWLNGVLIKATDLQLEEIKKLPFVKGILLNGDLKNARLVTYLEKENSFNKFETESFSDFGNSEIQNTMLGIDKMHAEGFKGEGVLIGILDSGFQNANSLSVFSSLFSEKRVVSTWDFVNDEVNVYNDHSHGTNVLSVMAANSEGVFVGTTPKASYALFRTEDVFSETRLEEINWLLGAERADSVGVDVINSSLGYYDFDGSITDYTLNQLDGNTSIITKAADWAVGKGIIVVNSAGNEGRVSNWQKIIMPADADSIISVAAVNSNLTRASFSSIGPSANGRIKPELAAMGERTTVASPSNTIATSNGTSFSSPLIAGLAAGFKQAYPTLSAMKIREILIKSATQAENPDEFLGYGIPNYERAKEIAEFEAVLAASNESLFIYPNPVSNEFNLKGIILDSEISLPCTLRIITSNGKEAFSKELKDLRFSLDKPIESLSRGMHYVVIDSEKKRIVRKFLKL